MQVFCRSFEDLLKICSRSGNLVKIIKCMLRICNDRCHRVLADSRVLAGLHELTQSAYHV